MATVMATPAAPSPVETLAWFLGHQDSAPERIHARGLWRDHLDGMGSALGSPDLSRDFRDWLERGEYAVVRERVRIDCPHPFALDDRATVALAAGPACPSCQDTGTWAGVRTTYKWPMRAAIAKAAGVRVKAGRPNLAAVLFQVARSAGDLEAAQSALSRSHPAMGDDATFRAHVAFALIVARQRYREDVPPRPYREHVTVASPAPNGPEGGSVPALES